MAAEIGFASFDISYCLPPTKPFANSLMGQVMYAGGDQRALWFSLDMLMLSVSLCSKLRADLSSRLNIPADGIVIHVMHNHTSMDDGPLLGSGYDDWLQILTDSAQEAMSSARSAYYSHIRCATPSGVFVRRRQKIDDIGKLCVFMGFDTTKDGEVDAARINKNRVAQWYGGFSKMPEMPDSMPYDEPVDDIDLVLFHNASGTPIGSIARFAGHVIAAGHSPTPHYNSDFPGVLRELIEERFGGVCMTINGPCGDITDFEMVEFVFPPILPEPVPSPPICMRIISDQDAHNEVKRLGLALYEPLGEFHPTSFLPVDNVRVNRVELNLPMRKDLTDIETAERKRDKWLARFNDLVASCAPLPDVKHAADRWLFYTQHPMFYGEWRYLWPNDLVKRTVTADVVDLFIGGIVLCAMPGEVFFATGRTVRDSFERDGLIAITAGECNGDIGYLPPADERLYGDYETCACVVVPEAADIVASNAIEM